MFSPSQNSSGGPAMATRSRRRQRNPSGDASLTQQPKTKRARGPLTESNHTNPDAQNQNAQPEMLELKNDRIARLPKTEGLENTPPVTRALRSQVAVRSKKPKQGERTSKSDGSVELVSTLSLSRKHVQTNATPVKHDINVFVSADSEPFIRQKRTRTPSANCRRCRTESVQTQRVSPRLGY